MNGDRVTTSPADDVAVELGIACNERIPPANKFVRKPSGVQLVKSWWMTLSRIAPENIGVAGLKYILVSRESRCRRLGWLGILTFAVTAFTYQIVDRGIYFSTFPLSVDISLKQTARELNFPKVIVCNSNAIVKSEAQARPAIDKILRNYENSHYNPNKTIPLTAEELRYIRTMNTSILFEEIKHKKEDMFLRVRFADAPVSLDDIIPVNTALGRCYQINDGLDGRQLLKASGGGKSFGLSLILNAEQEKYYYNTFLRDAAGFSIQLLDQDETHSLNEEGFQVGPGTSASVAMTVTQQYNAEPPYGVCGEKKLKYFDKYSRTKCLVECMTEAVVSKCGCRAASLPGNAPVCDVITVGTCSNAFFEQGEQNGVRHAGDDCQCPINCAERTFSVSLSTAKYPSAFRAGLLEKYINEGLLNYPSLHSPNRSFIEQNFVALDIFFTDVHTSVITQQAAYPLFSFLSDIGGAMGLWLGASLLTIFEILDLCGHSFFSTRR